ncbi:MAG: bifunctional metallophosphatase/5'-nucleotidase [Thiobacillaceae bacterium]
MTTALKPLVLASLLALSGPVFAATACTGNVTLGSIDSGVSDRSVNDSCINDLIVDTPNTWGNHGQFVSHVSQITLDLLRQRKLSALERSRIMRAAAQSEVGKTLDVRILGINDFHGALQGPTGTIDGKPVGGAEYVAGHARKLRGEVAHSLMFSNGDLIGASQLVSALFFDEPTIEVMNALGVDINTVGNHEFDKGKAEVLRMQNGGCHPTEGCLDGDGFDGARFTFLAANVIDQSTGKTLFPPYKVFNFKGNKVAVIGTVLKTTPSIVTPSGVAGLSFLDEAASTNALIPELRKQGVRTIIASIHEGGTESPSTSNYNDCNNLTGPILPIVAALDGEVDLVMTGHTHQPYVCQLNKANGQPVTVTAGAYYGRFITKADLTLDTQTKDVIAVTAQNVPTYRDSDVAADDIKAIVDKYDTLSAPLRNRVIGFHTADLTRTANAAGESFLGDLIADAQLHATKSVGFGEAVIAFMNPGGIRANLAYAASGSEGDGNITYGEAFTVQPFGNSLVTKTFTGAQIEQLLEQQFTGCPNNQPFNRILQVSRGFSYTWDNNRPACDKIDPASIKLNGVTLDPTASYRVTMNSFLADGGDLFTVFKEGTDPLGGAQDLDALEAWLQHYGPVDPATYPEAMTRIQRSN